MNDLITALIGCTAVAAPIGAWLGSRLTADKYKEEVNGLRATVRQQVAEAVSVELDNTRKANDTLMEVIASLKKETNALRRDVDKLRKAVEKIPSCPYSDDCPVSRQLQRSEEDTKAGEDK